MTEYLIEDNELGLGKCLILKTNWSPSYERILSDNKISIIRLSFSAGWKDSELFFADKLRKLKGLELYSWKITNLTPLYILSGLNYLGIQTDIKRKFELKKFPELKVLKINLNAKVKDLNECKNLEHINVMNFPYESFLQIANLTKLKRVQITSKKMISTEGLSNFSKIEELDFYNCKKLAVFSEFDRVNCLTNIKITNCPGIRNFDVFENLTNLTSLIIENCGELKTISFLKNCRKLKRLLIIGNTSIKDRDLSAIDALPDLKDVRISNISGK